MVRQARARRRRNGAIRALNDFLAVVAAFSVAFLIVRRNPVAVTGTGTTSVLLSYWLLGAVFGIAVVLVFRRLGLYRLGTSVLVLRELQLAATGISLAAAMVLAGLFVFEVDTFTRPAVLWGIGLGFVAVMAVRRLRAGASRALEGGDGTEHRTLIYGCGETGRLLMKKIAQAPHVGRRVVGFVDDYAAIGRSFTCRINQHDMQESSAAVLGRGNEIARLVTIHGVTELLITSSAGDSGNLRRIVPLARDCGIQIGIVPKLGDIRADELQAEDLGAVSVLRPYDLPENRFYEVSKRFADTVLSLASLIVVAPVWTLAVVLIRLESDGPAIFKQERIGKDGKRFVMYKFRTMKVDSPAYASSTLPLEPRVTRFGRILRMTSFDEVPQLLNVLRGDMSLVGPRPEMPFLVEEYSSLERKRLSVRPGLTGIWQLSPDRHGAEIHENVEYDLFYIRHRSLFLDLVVLIETAIFTVALVPRRIRRMLEKRAARSGGRSVESTSTGGPAGEARGKYVFVALDQRSNGSVRDSWNAGLSVARARADGGVIRVLATKANVEMYDALVKASALGPEGEGSSIVEYIPYERQGELRTVASSAQVVVTDLPHVAKWAREEGIETVDL